MKKENFGDLVMQEVVNQVNQVTDYLAVEYKGVKPFNKAEVSAKERLYWYDQLSPMDVMLLRAKHGDNVMSKFIYEHEMLKQKTGVKNASQSKEG